MIEAYIFAAAAVFALLAGWGTFQIIRDRLDRLQSHKEFANKFYSSVRPLIEDDETPEEVLRTVRFLNRKLTNRSSAREFFSIVSRGGIDVLSRPESPSFDRVREFFERRPELERCYAEAVGAALLSMSFTSVYYGKKVRLWFTALDSKDSRERAAMAFEGLGDGVGYGREMEAA